MGDILYVLGAVILISASAGLLGSFVIWNKLAYFSESLSHASLLGIAISVLLGFSPFYMIILVSFILSLLFIKTKLLYSVDSILSIVTSSIIALAMVIFPLDHSLESILLGNLYAISLGKVLNIVAIFFVILLTMFLRWEEWLLVAADKEIAFVSGINIVRIRMEFLMLLATFIAIAVELVGFFFVGALLIIPSATAGLFARSPISMVIISSFLGILAAILGLSFSWVMDTPIGASIVLSSSSVLVFCYFLFKKMN